VIGMFLQGGWVMYPLLIVSIIGLAVMIERIVFFSTIERGNFNHNFQKTIEELMRKGNIKAAIELCKNHNNSVAVMIRAILENYDRDRASLEDLIQEVATTRVGMMDKLMWLLGIIASVSPLLGLLGTVCGIITAFQSMAIENGLGKPELMAKGIGEALITTAAGLIIAIPCMIVHRCLENHIDNVISEMEKVSLRFLNIHK